MGSLDWFCQARGAGAAAATQRLAGLRVRTCLEVHVQGNGAEVEERRGQGACRARYVGRSVGQIRSVLAWPAERWRVPDPVLLHARWVSGGRLAGW